IEIRPGGLALHFETELRPTSPTARLLKGSKPSPFAELDALPAGRVVYDAYVTGPVTLEKLGPLAFGVAVEEDGEGFKEVRGATDDLIKAGPGGRSDGLGFPPASVQAWAFDEPARAETAYLKLVEALPPGAAFHGAVIKDRPEIRKSARTYKGVTY